MKEPAWNDKQTMTVVYIIGAGRSGSTLLDTVLGTHEHVDSYGEIINLAKLGWIGNEYCACGSRANQCEYWQAVHQEWEHLTGSTAEDYLNLQVKFERFRSWPKVLLQSRIPSAELIAYREQTSAIYQAISKVSGNSIIIDSSKLPLRAYHLLSVAEIDLRLIHLVRDGRGVAWSLMKGHKKNAKGGVQRELRSWPTWGTALVWTMSNLQAEWVAKKCQPTKASRIRYEDVLDCPERALVQIGKLADIDYSGVLDTIKADKEIPLGHTIAGNRMRMSGSIRLRKDECWRVNLSRQDQKIFWSIAGWLMRRYGYAG